MEVSLHELKHHIDIFELPRTGRQHDVLDLHNVCDTTDRCQVWCGDWFTGNKVAAKQARTACKIKWLLLNAAYLDA